MPTTSNSACDIMLDAARPAAATRSPEPQQRQAEQHREEQHLQDVAARERADDGVGNDVEQEIDRAQVLRRGRVGATRR